MSEEFILERARERLAGLLHTVGGQLYDYYARQISPMKVQYAEEMQKYIDDVKAGGLQKYKDNYYGTPVQILTTNGVTLSNKNQIKKTKKRKK